MFLRTLLTALTLLLPAISWASSIKSKAEFNFKVGENGKTTSTLSSIKAAISSDSVPNFYAFGTRVGDNVLPRDDDGFSRAIDIPSGLPTFSSTQRRAFVNTNGMISFTNGINEYKPKIFPLNGTEWLMLAIFWTDVDISPNEDSGTVYYRRVLPSSDKFLLDQLTSEVRQYFPNMIHFEAQFGLIATWENVAPYKAHSYGIPEGAKNTFQASLVTDGRHSFVIYRYHAIEWSYQLSTKMTFAQAGVNSGDGRWAAVDGSGSSAIASAATRRSNVGRPGVWAFRIDQNQVLLAECIPFRSSRRPQTTPSLRISPPWIHFSGDTTISLSAPCLDLSRVQRADCQLTDLINGEALTEKIPAVFSTIRDEASSGSLSCQIPPIPSFATNATVGNEQSVLLRLTAVDKAGKVLSFVGTLNVLMTVQQPDKTHHIKGINRFIWSGLERVKLRWDATSSYAKLLGAKPKLKFEALVFTGTVQDGRLLSTDAEVFPLDDNLLAGNRNRRSFNHFGLKGEQSVRLDLLEARIWERIPLQSPALLMSSSVDQKIDNSVYFLDGETIVSGSSRVTSKVPLGVILRLVDPAGNANFALTTSIGVYRSFAEHPVFVCIDWINREMTRVAKTPKVTQTGNETEMGCPPLERQASADFRFQTDSVCRSGSTSAAFCSDFRPFKCYEPVESRSHLCCYSSGRLCPNCGTTTFASPTSRLLEHIFSDVFPTMSCCPSLSPGNINRHHADQLSSAPLCQTTFRKVRPVPDNGTLYRAPRLAAFYGDPHLQTLDGFSYTYNGAGLFQLLETVQSSSDDGSEVYLSIQGLFEPLGEGTVIQALSIFDGETVVDIFVREANSVVVYVNGTYLSPFSTSTRRSAMNPNAKLDDVEVTQSLPGAPGPAFVSVRRTDNFRVFVETVNSTALSALVFLDERHLSQTRGLLGVWNRKMDDDLTLPNNTVLPLNSSASVIHHVFGQSWSIAANMSHFRVMRRQSSFNNAKIRDFRPLFADSPEMVIAARQNSVEAAKCDKDLQCLFDLLATGRADVAKSTLNFRKKVTELQHDLKLDDCPFTADQLVVINAPSGDIYTTPCPHGQRFGGLSVNEFCKITAPDQLSSLQKRALSEVPLVDKSDSPAMAIVQLPVCSRPREAEGVNVGGVILVNSMLHVIIYAVLVSFCLVLLILLAYVTTRQRLWEWWNPGKRGVNGGVTTSLTRRHPHIITIDDDAHRMAAESSISGDSETNSSRASNPSTHPQQRHCEAKRLLPNGRGAVESDDDDYIDEGGRPFVFLRGHKLTASGRRHRLDSSNISHHNQE